MTNLRPPEPRLRADGSRHWTAGQITAQIRWLHEALGHLAAIMPATLDRVTDWTASPLGGGSDEPKVSGGGRNLDGSKSRTPTIETGTKALERLKRDDPATADTMILIMSMQRVGPLVDSMLRATSRLQIVEDAPAALSVSVPGAGTCANLACGREVAGGQDRLRGGRCDACRKYLDRTGTERTRELCWPALHGVGEGDAA